MLHKLKVERNAFKRTNPFVGQKLYVGDRIIALPKK